MNTRGQQCQDVRPVLERITRSAQRMEAEVQRIRRQKHFTIGKDCEVVLMKDGVRVPMKVIPSGDQASVPRDVPGPWSGTCKIQMLPPGYRELSKKQKGRIQQVRRGKSRKGRSA